MKNRKTVDGDSSGNQTAQPSSAQPRLTLPLDATGAIADAGEWMRLHDESPDGFAIFRAIRDRAGRIVDLAFVHLNPAGERMSGKGLADVRGRGLLEVFAADRASGYFDRCARVAETGVAEVFELPFAGGGIDGWWRNVAVKFGDGAAVTFSDITERKRTEGALRDAMSENERTRARLATILKAAPVAIAFFDREGRYRMVNEALTRLNGIAAEDHLGRTVGELLPQYAQMGDELMRRVIAGGEPVTDIEMIGEMPGMPGEIRAWMQQWWPVRDSSGETLGAGVIVQDVTDNRRDAEAVKEAEALYRSLTNAIPQMVFMNDANGLGLYVNEKWHEYTGLARSGREDWLSALHPDEVESAIQRWRTGIAEGRSYETEYRFRRADGTYRWQLARAVPLRDGAGVIRRWIGTMTDIDDLKRMQERLRDSEHRWRTLIDANVVGIVVADENRVIDANQRFLDMVGYRRDEIVGERRLVKLTPGEYAALDSRAREELAATGAVAPFEKEFIRKDGSRVPALLTGARLDRSPLTWIGFVMDLTERKRAEEQIRENERRWRSLVESKFFGVVIANEERVLEANQVYLDIIGYSGEELRAGRIPRENLTPPEYRHLDIGALEELRLVGSSTPFEKEYLRRDGTRVPVFIGSTALPTQPLTWIGFVVDLTEQKRTQIALRESEQRLRILTRTAPVYLYTLAPTGEVEYASAYFHEFTGRPAGAAAANGYRESIHPDDAARVMIEGKQAHKSGRPFEVEYRLRRADGVFRWFKSRTVPVRDENGNIVRWYGGSIDIHEQKEVQAALKEADRRKDEFLAMLAHELRNPLAPIVNALEIMRRDGEMEPRLARMHDVIERQTSHLTRLVDDLLEVSRITAGKITLRREAVEIGGALTQALESARPLMEMRKHQVEVMLPDGPMRVDGDAIRLTQVLVNLLNNAAKYTPEGGTIHVRAQREAEQAVVRVRDNGYGIAPDLLPHVFDLFTQGERAPDRAQGGLGIGLTLVRRLVELHGGRVEASSAGAGYGSEFIVRLPLMSSPVEAESIVIPGEPSSATARRVLIVDDNRDWADSLAELLGYSGYEVAIARDGPSAVDAARSFDPEVALVDIGLPGMDGHEVARALRAMFARRKLLLIAISGYGQERDRARSKAAGFDYHMVKPVAVADLLDRIAAG